MKEIKALFGAGASLYLEAVHLWWRFVFVFFPLCCSMTVAVELSCLAKCKPSQYSYRPPSYTNWTSQWFIMFLCFLKEELLSSQEKSPCSKDVIVKVDYSKKAETDTSVAFVPSSSERTSALHKGN